MRRFLLLTLLVLSSVVALVWAEQTPPLLAGKPLAAASYADLLAQAQTLRAEQSWALAQQHYEAAERVAKTEPERAAAALGGVECGWRAEGDVPWNRRGEFREKWKAQFEALAAPYAKGRPLDDAGAAIELAWSDFLIAYYFQDEGALHLRKGIEYLASKPATPANVAAVVAALRERQGVGRGFGGSIVLELIRSQISLPQLKEPRLREEQAWVLRELARHKARELGGQERTKENIRQMLAIWPEAVAAAKGTSLEPAAVLESELHRLGLPWFGQDQKPLPEELERAIVEGNRLAEKLPGGRENEELVQRWRNMVEAWTKPQVSLRFPVELSPGEALPIELSGAGWSRAHLKLASLSPREYLEFEYAARTDGSAHSAPKGKEIWSSVLVAAESHPLAWVTRKVEEPPALSAGLYLFSCDAATSSGAKIPCPPQLVVVSHFAIDFVQAADEWGVLAKDKKAGEVQAGASVRIEWLSHNGFDAADRVTDPRGFAAVSAPKTEHRVALVARVHDEWVPRRGGFWGFGYSNSNRWAGDMILDQPLYRPGDTVRWKLVAREGEPGAWKMPKTGKEVGVGFILNDEQTPLWVGTARWSEFGSIDGSFAIPADAPPGEVRVRVAHGEKEPVFQDYSIFRIDHFEPPAVVSEIVLASPQVSLVPGGNVQVGVRCRYFSGGALAGARVEFEFSIEPNWSSEKADEVLQRWQQSHLPRYASTDSQGYAQTEISIDKDFPTGTKLVVSAKVTPSGGTAVAASQGFEITASGLRLLEDFTSAHDLVTAGNPWTFKGVLIDGAGKPAVVPVEARLEQLRWTELWLNEKGEAVPETEWRAALVKARGDRGALVRQGWRRFYADYVATTVVSEELTPGLDGAFVFSRAVLDEGLYRLAISRGGVRVEPVQDRAHNTSRSLFPSPIFGHESDTQKDNLSLPHVLSVGDGSRLSLPPEAVVITPSLTVRPGEEAATGFCVFSAWDETVPLILARPSAPLSSVPILRKGRYGRFTVSAPQEIHRSEIWNATLLTGSSEWNAPTCEVNIQPRDKPLTVEITPSAKEVRPGATMKAAVRVLTNEGQPLRGEVVLAVADKAVKSLVGVGGSDYWPLPFYGTVKASRVSFRSESGNGSAGPSIDGDPRPGIGGVDDGFIELTPFTVNSEVGGYRASNTLAGARLRTGFGLAFDKADPSATMLGQTGGAEPPAPPTVGHLRVRFDATAFWAPTLRTDANGRADVSFTLPDNLTEWRWEATAIGADGQSFGRGLAFTRTDLPFQARLSLPEVVVAGDTVKPRATLINQGAAPAAASVALEVSGSIQKSDIQEPRRVEVPAQAESNTEWSLVAGAVGHFEAVLRAQAGSESDGMQRRAQVREDGLLQSTYASFLLEAGKKTSAGSLALPKPLDPARTAVQVRVDPVGVGALVDAIPYLVHYPFGCVEQTLNRFMPAVVVKHFLLKQGLEEEKIDARLLATEPNSGAKASLDDVIEAGLARLKSAARADGFGWWPAAPRRDLWMTAYVAWGLHLAREAGVDVDESLWETAREGTLAGAVEAAASQEDRAWALAVISVLKLEVTQDKALRDAWATLFRVRADLSPSARASLLLAADRFGAPDQRGVLLRNLYDGALKEQALGMTLLHWEGRRDRCWAGDTPTEATALTLLALMQVAPQDERIEPAAHWLLLNRRLERWDTTRSTAFAVVALQRWLVQRKGGPLSDEVAVFVEGKEAGRIVLSTETLLTASPVVAVPTGLLTPGSTAVEIKRLRGNTPFFVTASSEAWATGEAVKPFSQVLAIERHWQRQVAVDTVRGDVRVTPVALPAIGTVRREESVQARVALKTAIDLAYVKVEVPLPGGTRPAALLSGWDARLVRASTPDEEGIAIYREAHPGKSVFFLNELPVGEWVLVFDLQAEVAGDYRTLPAEAEAMYVPEIRGNSDSRRLVIESK